MSLIRDEDGDDVLSLAYAPYKKRTGDRTAVPKPLIDDEAEFEMDLHNNIPSPPPTAASAPSDADDAGGEDEFDFDEHAVTAEEQVQALTAALLTKYSSADSQVEESVNNTDDLLDKSIDALLPKKEEVGSDYVQQRSSGDDDAVFDLKQAALEALGAIRFQYERGLDDQNIADSNRQLQDGSAANVTLSKDMTVILEGDKEDEEDSPIQVTTTSVSKTAVGAAMTAEELALHEEWSNLATETPPPPPATGLGTSPLKPPKPLPVATLPAMDEVATLLPPPPPSSSSLFTESLISYDDALRYLMSTDLSRFNDVIVTESSSNNNKSSLGGLMSMMGLKTKTNNSSDDFTFIFQLAQLEYDPADRTMLQILRSIFWRLVGEGQEILPMGAHWELIGFQGSDPRTDINRSMKMLAVLLAARLVEHDKAFSQLLYRLSIDRGPDAKFDQSWPFFCVSIMFTKEAVQALRSGELNKLCNKRGSSLEVLYVLYKACFYSFAKLLQSSSPSTVVHHAVHLSAVRERVAKDSLRVIDDAERSRNSLGGLLE